MTRHLAAALRALVGASFVLGGCSGSSSDGPVQPSGGTAAKLSFTVEPSAVVAGAAMTPAVQVTVQDAQGNTVTTATNSITLAVGTNPANGILSGTTTVAAVSGVATFSTLNLNAVGAGYTLTASATGLTSATSSAFNISAGAAAKLIFTVQPSAVVAGAAMTPAVQVSVQDALGNTVTTATNSITVAIGTNPAGGTLSGTTTVAAVNGVATFATLSIDKAGTGYTLTASAPSVTPATSTSFVTTAAAATSTGLRLSSGVISTCALTTAGTAYCWGSNAYGELGNGDVNRGAVSLTPIAVSGGLTFRSVSVGSYSACGVTTGAAAYCWGADSLGQLGNGSIATYSVTPVAVSGGLSFANVSVGYFSACGVTTSGAAYCWGDNSSGQLGNGSKTNSLTPVAVSGGHSFTVVSAGFQTACGLTSSGAAYCWGSNSEGALGNNAGSLVLGSTVPVAVSGGLAFASVSAGNDYVCGVTAPGAAYCWGGNAYGELGIGSTDGMPTPVAVSGGITFATVSTSGLGIAHTCGVATSGVAYCWGANVQGNVGNGSFLTSSTTPLVVSGGLTFGTVSAGGFSGCGVTTSRVAYCWGSGVTNGSGSPSNSPGPVAVAGGLTF